MSQSTVDLIDTALITGGSGGIGKAMAEYLISKGKKVIIAGRTESKLKDVAKEIGATDYYVVDTGDTMTFPDIIERMTKQYPNLNCLINNAGVQRPFQFPGSQEKPDYDFDLSKADNEININIRGPMHLLIGLLPHFTRQDAPKAVILNVSSILGYNPSSVINPVYNGTKAWVHMFTLNLRTQFKESNKLKVVELVPPSVSTDLHRERVNPDDNKGENSGALSLEDFMKEVTQGLENGDDTITAGPGNKLVKAWTDSIGTMYEKAVSG